MEKDFDISEQNRTSDPAISQSDDTQSANDGSEVKIVDSFESDDNTEGKQGLPSFSLDNEKYQKKKKVKRTLTIAIPTSFLVIAVIFVISYFLLPILSRGGDNPQGIVCAHIDENLDNTCDVCDTVYMQEVIVCIHIDVDLNGTCDSCGEALGEASCTHEDLDVNDICDLCGADMS